MARAKKEKPIYITEFDLERLERLLEQTGRGARTAKHIEALEDELSRAEVVEPKDIPANVITMNSRVLLKDLDSGEATEYTLCFPAEANPAERRVSILAPVGTALIGYRTGDTITWQVPGGARRFKVGKILYQPEAAGDFHR